MAPSLPEPRTAWGAPYFRRCCHECVMSSMKHADGRVTEQPCPADGGWVKLVYYSSRLEKASAGVHVNVCCNGCGYSDAQIDAAIDVAHGDVNVAAEMLMNRLESATPAESGRARRNTNFG